MIPTWRVFVSLLQLMTSSIAFHCECPLPTKLPSSVLLTSLKRTKWAKHYDGKYMRMYSFSLWIRYRYQSQKEKQQARIWFPSYIFNAINTLDNRTLSDVTFRTETTNCTLPNGLCPLKQSTVHYRRLWPRCTFCLRIGIAGSNFAVVLRMKWTECHLLGKTGELIRTQFFSWLNTSYSGSIWG